MLYKVGGNFLQAKKIPSSLYVVDFRFSQVKSNKSIHAILLIGSLLSLFIVSAMNPNSVLAQGEKFKAKLKGDNEVPPVTSAATGKAKFKIKDDGITTNINITGIADIKMAHLHAGSEGQNGDPVVDLLKTGNLNKTAGGVIIKGMITASDLQGAMAGKTLKDLLTTMGDEKTYVNIHTSKNPNGEIRGQIKVSGGNATSAESSSANSTSEAQAE